MTKTDIIEKMTLSENIPVQRQRFLAYEGNEKVRDPCNDALRRPARAEETGGCIGYARA